MKRIIRNRHLTPEEAAEYRAIREEIEREMPQLRAEIGERMARIRDTRAALRRTQSVGEALRLARGVQHKSVADLADAAGVSEEYLARLERDEIEPVFSEAARLAEALDISLDDLATGVAAQN